RQQAEHAGKTQHLQDQIGNYGADRPEQIAGGGTGGVGETGIGGRPGEQTYAAGAAAQQYEEAQQFAEPTLDCIPYRGREQWGRLVAPIRHTYDARLRGYLHDTLKRFPDRCRIMYQRDAHKIAAGVGAVPVFVSQVNTWQNLDTALLPDG